MKRMRHSSAGAAANFGPPGKTVASAGITAEAWAHFFAGSDLPRVASLSSGTFLERIGLERPYAPLVERVLGWSDALDVSVRVMPVRPIHKQWNAVFGRYSFNTDGIVDESGSPYVRGMRPFCAVMNGRADAMYRVVHEVAHALIYDLALQGLFRTLDNGWQLHVFGEMFAEHMSHYELGASAYGYWRKRWRPIAETLGQDANIGRACISLGLTTPEARASLAYNAYFRRHEVPAPLSMKAFHSSPELLGMWTFQRNYAAKTWISARMWNRLYWQDPHIRHWMRTFVPYRSAKAWLRSSSVPVQLSSWTDLRAQFPRFVEHWRPPPRSFALRHSAVRHIQRAALAMAQLQRLVRDPRAWRGYGRSDTELASETTSSYDRLIALNKRVDKERSISSSMAGGIRAEVDEVVDRLVATLESISGAVVLFRHPALDGLDMSEEATFECPLYLDRPSGREGFSVARAPALRVQLDRLRDDLADVRQEYGASDWTRTLGDLLVELAAHAARLDLAMGDGDAQKLRAACQAAVRWIRSLAKSNRLPFCYRWSWLRDLPFIEPRVGFRVV